MAHTIHVADEALDEIDEAMTWYAERSVASAVRWYLKLKEAIRSLEENPERCELAPEAEWCDRELRQVLFGKKRGMYRIIFEIRDEIVYVLRVRHCARDWLKPDDL